MYKAVVCLIFLLAVSVHADTDINSPYSWSYVGPYGGDVRSLVIDPSDPSRLYLGTNDGQMYRSTDSAGTWTRLLSFNHPGYSVDKVIIDETNPKTIYVPIWWVANDTDGTIYKSTDGGDSWRELKGITGHSVRALTIAPDNPKILVTAAIDAAYQSDDAGETWRQITPSNHPDIIRLHSVAIDPRDHKIIYLGTEHLPWKTEDGGKTWYSIKGHPTDKKQQFIDDSDIFTIVIDRKEPDKVLSSACSGIYQSFNAAQTWTKFQGIPFTSRRTHTIYPDPTNRETIYSGTTEGLWKTVNNGQNWRLMTSLRTVVNAIAIHPSNPNKVYLGIKYGGVLVSEDGGEHFRSVNTGFVNRQISTLLADRKVQGRVYAGVLFNGYEGGLYISNDNGQSWQAIGSGLESQDIYTIYQSQTDDKVLYAGANTGLYRSTDRGETWTRVIGQKVKPAAANSKSALAKSSRSKSPSSKSLPASIDSRVTNIVQDNFVKNGLLIASWNGLFRLDESKGLLEKIKIADYEGRVLSIGTHAQRPESIYAGTSSGLYNSRDGGKSWQAISIPATEEGVPIVQSIGVNPREPDTLFIGTNRACYFTSDAGKSWQRIGRGLPYGEPLAIQFSSINPAVVAVGDYKAGGVFLSTDGGKNFKRVDQGLPSVRIRALSFDPFDIQRLYVGSFSAGIYLLNVNSGLEGQGPGAGE
jgi:photosystem II stability/assembly factor-like uncharacterized protein